MMCVYFIFMYTPYYRVQECLSLLICDEVTLTVSKMRWMALNRKLCHF